MKNATTEMHVIKRDGSLQPLNLEKTHWRIKSMCSKPEILEFQRRERPESYDMNKNLPELKHANCDVITLKTIQGLYDKIPTSEIDVLSSEIAQGMVTVHPDNSTLAKRLLVSNIQKNTLEILVKRFPAVQREIILTKLFAYSMEALYFNKNKKGEMSPLVGPYVLAIARQNPLNILDCMDYSRDFTNHDYLGIKILEKGYLLRCYDLDNIEGNHIIIERPSVSTMRIAIGLHCAPTPYEPWYNPEDIKEVLINSPEVVKERYLIKYSNKNNSKNSSKDYVEVIMSSQEPHKHSWLNPIIFSEKYWLYMLKKETGLISKKTAEDIVNTYNLMSTGKYTPATPSRFNLGTLKPQGSSCFLIGMEDDSLKGIYNTLAKQSQISKYAGGVGMWVSNIRSSGSYIAGTNGVSNGLPPMLGLFNSSAKYVDQGGGKRPGTIAVYCEIWHADIFSFIELKRKQGSEASRARSLFYGMWIADEFMRCLRYNKPWYLFDPVMAPKLYDCYDEGFSTKYLTDEYVRENKAKFLFTYRYRKYVRQGKYEKVINPSDLMVEIVNTVKESGVPYMMAKDACNRKSNQKNLGTIKGSNLCCEIIQYSGKNENNEDETAVCNLSSIALNTFVTESLEFDFKEFNNTVRQVVRNLNKIIDVNFYPTDCTRRSNFRHKPMGIGVQGESDMMAMMRLPWNDKEANRLRFYIFENMYYTCLETSVELAKEYGPYETFKGSPADQGLLSYDLWLAEGRKLPFTLSLDWDSLKEKISIYGLRNSLFISPMPTASTSGILGNSPCIEPFNSLVYNRKVGAGEVTIVNKYLVQDLLELGLWDEDMSNNILMNAGSIQSIPGIPKEIKDIYKTVYDLNYKDIIKAASIRGWFVDQSQSMNLFVDNVTVKNMTQAWSMGWSKGLKTLSYYIRTLPSVDGQKMMKKDGDRGVNDDNNDLKDEGPVCSRDNPDCLSCGS